MSLIIGEGLTMSWSDLDVLKNASVTLAPQDRVGLVGPNGEGKTTLIRILIGLLEPTAGTVRRKTGLRIGYLPQDTAEQDTRTLRQSLLDVFADLHRMEQDLHNLAHEIQEDHDPQQLARYGELQHEFEVAGGYDYVRRMEQVLTGLKFPEDTWDRPLDQFSGGQQMRAKLARVLLEDPDVLMLDEPTNHMDLDSVEWLQNWLGDFRGATIIISHDRYFLDHVTSRTWEVANAGVECYPGNYTHYLAQRAQRLAERMRRWESQQEYIRQTEDFIRRFLSGQRSSEAKGRRTRLQRFLRTEAIPKPREHARISVRFKVTDRAGDQVLQLTDLRAGFKADAPLVEIEALNIQRGQRIAIVGPNGCGKTTLLKTILGERPALTGQVGLGANVRIGYLSQAHTEHPPHITAMEAVRQIDPAFTQQRVRGLLGSLLLSGDDAFKQLGELSGGERSRVFLARLMVQQANVLVMDEPTNHLDIQSQEVLQDVLSDFDGTILFVSHDRYLIDALATDIWAMHDQAITPLHGDWERYLRWRDRKAETPKGQAAAESQSKQQRQEQRETRREDQKLRRQRESELKKLHRRIEKLESQIHPLEDALKALNEEISAASVAGDLEKVAALGSDYAAQDQHLQTLYAEWEELTAAAEED